MPLYRNDITSEQRQFTTNPGRPWEPLIHETFTDTLTSDDGSINETFQNSLAIEAAVDLTACLVSC